MTLRALPFILLAAATSLVWNCAAPKAEEPLPVVKVAPQRRPAMTIYRHELDGVLQRGLQPLIAELNLRPALEEGRFVGWRLSFLKPMEPPYSTSAVRPGDIVTAVNGDPIEQPGQMMAAWKALGKSTELRFSVIRAGKAQDIVYAISDR